VDLLDEANSVIIEADGKVKYTSAQEVWREKRREDALRDSGFEVVRFTHADYCHQPPWLASYRQALTRARVRKALP
jgi:very-short-patch-repair endonuclease